MALIPDPWLILIQAIPFAVAIFLLDRIVYRPMIAYLLEREDVVEGSRRRAAALQAEAEQALAIYEQRLEAARAEAAALRKKLVGEALAGRDARLAEARREAEARVDEAVERIGTAREEAAEHMRQVATALASEIARQVLQPARAA